MYELRQVTEKTYYIDCPAKMGICLLGDGTALLVDSGNDKTAGKKALKHLDSNGWTLAAVFNTHSHADHIGGNQLIHDRTGVNLYTPDIESAFTRWPVLEPSLLYGGYPPAPLRNKFLMAQPSPALSMDELLLPQGFERILLPGHSLNMQGLRTPDNVVFLADCLSGENILEKYHVNFIYDVGAYLETLDKVEGLTADWFVPAHAPACADIRPLAQRNRDTVHEIAGVIETLCAAPKTPDEVLAGVFDHYDLGMDFGQYVLVGSTVRSYLAWLSDQGRICATFAQNRLYWQKP